MSNYFLGDTVSLGFITQSIGGAAADADSLPTASLRRNGVVDVAVTVTITHNATGDYSASFAIPATYTPGDSLELIVAATVGGVSGKAVYVIGSISRELQIAQKTKGRVWVVDPIRGNDFSGNGTWAKPFATLLPTNATVGGFPIGAFPPSSGDIIWVLPGTCALGNNQYVMTPGTMLIGSGPTSTTITSTWSNGVSIRTICRFATGCTIKGLTIQAIGGTGVYAAPLGDDGIDAPGVTLEDVAWIAVTDGLFMTGATTSVVGRRVDGFSSWDNIRADGGCSFVFFDSRFRTVTGTTPSPNNNSSVRCYDGSVGWFVRTPVENVASSVNANRLTQMMQVDAFSRLMLIDSPVFLKVDGSTIQNFNVAAGGICVVENSPYDPSLVSGTIIDLNKLESGGGTVQYSSTDSTLNASGT